jgi:asparagine synthase (glutamine-hydrolysing)
MCGICGKISFGNQPIEESLVRNMCRSFSYRGPDDEGVYINTVGKKDKGLHIGLGHQRLSIIDLSQAGHQPMANEDKTIWITYNGEIYNFKELRRSLLKKGHTFRSNTDTEVVLHLYEEEGLQAVKRLNGMFAFALWDENKGRLWVCRDRIGIKPLLYQWNGKDFVFASEIKALLCDPSIPKEIDYDALQLYLTFNYIPAPYTIFKGIRKLEPGNYLVVINGKIEEERYWDPPQSIDPDIVALDFSKQEKFFKEKLYEVLSESVKARMIADVPLGAFLSGGIDSSIIVALMAKHSSQPIQTFSIGFEGAQLFDETTYAQEVAALYKTDHHEFKLTYRDMIDIFSDVLSTFDEPFADSSAIPTFIVSRETRKYVTVALSGDGGDELFAGYRSYLGEYWYKRYMMIPAVFRKYLLEKPILMLPDSRNIRFLEYIRRLKKFIRSTRGNFSERMLSLKEIAPGDVRRRLIQNYDGVDQELILRWVVERLNQYKDDRLNTILYSDLKDSLPGDMLNKVDWMSMKNSLEVRVPFLDHRVVELAFQMPGALKLNRGKTKYILKETFKEILPRSLYRRPKAGFEIPISQWLKTDLKFLLKDYLDEGRIRKQGIFDHDTITGLVADHRSNRTDTSWVLWNLIVFQYWYDLYFI